MSHDATFNNKWPGHGSGRKQPTWPAYLEQFHEERTGITQDTLGLARSNGIDPYQWLLEALPATDRLLDLACGSGPIALRRPDGWIGVDRSAAELALARSRGDTKLARVDGTRLPFAQASFPAVVCSMALMIIQPLDALLAELARVLTAGGIAAMLIPGTLPLGVRDVARYARLMVALRLTHLGYPNDRLIAHLGSLARAAGLRITDDRRRRFSLPLRDSNTGRLFVRSLYLPGVAQERINAASNVAAGWAGTEIGIPLRRVTLQRHQY